MKVCVIDYGMSNLLSISRALEAIGGEVKIATTPDDIKNAERLVLPGVGAFPQGIKELKERNLFHPIIEYIG